MVCCCRYTSEAMPMLKKLRADCMNCGRKTSYSGYKYCSNRCQADYQYKMYIQEWLAGQKTGLQGHGGVSRHKKRYQKKKNEKKFCFCSCSKVTPVPGEPPFVADHIEGTSPVSLQSCL